MTHRHVRESIPSPAGASNGRFLPVPSEALPPRAARDTIGVRVWTIVRIIGGFALGLAVLHLAALLGITAAARLLASPPVADAAAMLIGLLLTEAAVRTERGRALERRIRRLRGPVLRRPS